MDLRGLDRQKAQAHDALVRGEFEDASALYEALQSEYARHGFAEGTLALTYNHLLSALGAGASAEANQLLGALVQGFLDASRTSVLAREVLDGLSRLLGQGLPGVDHALIEAARAVIADRGGVCAQPAVGSWSCDQLPGVEHLSGVSPAVSACLVATAVNLTWAQPAPPPWLEAARAVFPVGPESGTLVGVDAVARDAWRRESLLQQHPAVVEALRVALMEAPLRAPLWGLTLELIESGELPDRLDYLPGSPREVGLRARADLHGRLAAAVEQVVGAEELAALHWTYARQLIDRWRVLVEQRVARGGGRSVDIEAEAESALLAAAACRATGDLGAAREWLARSVERARRDALTGDGLVAEIRLCAAEMAERAGDRTEAAAGYRQVAEQTLPIMVEPSPAGDRLAAIDAHVLEGQAYLVLAAARALAGLRRTAEDIPVGLEAARDALAQARPACRPEAVAAAALEVELTAAFEGDLGAGPRAIEAARRLRQPEAALVAGLLTLGEGSAPDSLGELSRMAAAGQPRLAAELGIAERLRRSGDLGRADALLGNLAESLGAPARALGGGRWDHLLGAHADWSRGLGEAVAQARGATARRLLWGWRRAQHLGLAVAARERTLDGRAAAILRGQLAEGGAEPTPFEALLGRSRRDRAQRPAPSGPRLEFAALGETMVGCLIDEDGPIVRRLGIDRRLLADRIARFRGLLEEGAFTAVGRAAAVLGDAVLGPFVPELARINRLTLAPDGPLGALPFATLMSPPGAGLLGDRLLCITARASRTVPLRPATGGVLRVLGDDATASELRLAAHAAYPGDLSHGADLAPGALVATLAGARVAYLVGEVNAAGLALSADGPPISPEQLADALREAAPAAVVLAGPVIGRHGRRLLQACLGAVPVVIVRRWAADQDCETAALIVEHLMQADDDATEPAWAAALGLQAALRAGLPGWPAYEICVAED